MANLAVYTAAPLVGALVTVPFGDERLGAIVTGHDPDDADFFEATVIVPCPGPSRRPRGRIETWKHFSLLVSHHGADDTYSWDPA